MYLFPSHDRAVNNFTYLPDDNVSEGLGDGTITISNANLPSDADIVSLPFAASATKTDTPFQNVAIIEKVAAGYTEQTELIETEPRIVYTTQNASGITITDSGGSTGTTGYKEGRFISSEEVNNLGFDNSLLADYWEAITGVVQSYKKVTAYFKLNEIDIQSLNFFNPVFVNATNGRATINGYFYINNISNFTGEQSTEVELIKLDL